MPRPACWWRRLGLWSRVERRTPCLLIRWKDLGVLMRTLTMSGVAPDPNWRHVMDTRGPIEPAPVFQQTPKHDFAAFTGIRDAIPAFTVPPHPWVQNLST